MMNWKEFQQYCRQMAYREFGMIGVLWKAYKEMHEGIFELRGDMRNPHRDVYFVFEILEYYDFDEELEKIESIPELPVADREKIWEARRKRWEEIKDDKPRQTFDTFFFHNSNRKFKMENGELICLD